MPHTEFRQRIDDRVDHDGKRGRRSALPAGAYPEPIGWRRHFAGFGREGGERVCPRHGIVHETRAQHLAICRFIIALFQQRLPDPLGDAAMCLAMQDQRVDRSPDIIDRGIADDLHPACFRIDLNLADVRAVGEASDRQRLVGNAVQRALQFLGQARVCLRGPGDFEDADLAVGSGHSVLASIEFDVGLACFEQEACDLAAFFDDLIGCRADDRCGQLHGTAGMGPAARLDPSGVVGDVIDAVERDSKPFRNELGEACLVPLPGRHRAHHQFDPAFRAHSDLSPLAWRAAGDFDVVGNADTAQFAALPGLGTPGGKAFPVAKRHRGIHCFPVVTAIVGVTERIGVRLGRRRDQVPTAQCDRIHPELVGGKIDQPFNDKNYFRPAGAAIGRCRDGIGHRGLAAKPGRGNVVHIRQQADPLLQGHEGCGMGTKIA